MARPALAGREQLLKARPPSLRVMRRRRELGAGGATASGEVEAVGVEPDRPPWRPQATCCPASRASASCPSAFASAMSRSSASRQRRFTLAGAENLRRRQGGGAAKAAIEMHVLDPEPVDGEIGEAGVEAGLWIAL